MRFGGIGLPKDPALCSPNKSEAEPDAELVWILPIADTYSEPKTLDDPKIPLNQVELRVRLRGKPKTKSLYRELFEK